jgi:glycerate kinase
VVSSLSLVIGRNTSLGGENDSGMRVLVAPDKFGGTLTAAQAAAAIARGWAQVDPTADLQVVPVADGGEGTLDTLVTALGGERRSLAATGPLGEAVEAEFGLVQSSAGLVAIVEMASASGLRLVPPDRRDPLRATTRGTGELILAAARERPVRIVVCLGGSATNDGGAGMAQALGVRLLDRAGAELGPGGLALRDLATIDASGMAEDVRGREVLVATDVDSPLSGPAGASAVFGPQKGASPEDVRALDVALRHFGSVIREQLAVEVADVPGAGAAGGLGAGLMAFLGGRIRRGFDVVGEALDLARQVEAADAVVTGEGRYDQGTERGKAPAGVLRLGRDAGCRTVVIAGQIAEGVRPPAELVISLTDRAGSVEDAMARAEEHLEAAGEEAARWAGEQA